jgi:sphinganine-1-phosphate aldolase
MKNKKILAEEGMSTACLLEKLPICKTDDARWDQGKIFGFVYHPGKDYATVSEAYFRSYMYDSSLNPSIFPSLRNFEKDIITMAGELMHGKRGVTGSVTTGGTESIFLALKVARDLARDKHEDDIRFEVILPETIHPAFLKACDILSLKAIIVPVRQDKRADPKAMQEAINDKTILLACSAPCFPYGLIDPVSAIGKIAQKHNLLFHVDACLGGFLLPFLEDMGNPAPAFDFRVPGVTSISMDAHKYGYAPKGTSIILYRNRSYRKKQFFVHADWPGGIFASTTFMGTKSGGPLAGCWAIMNHLGREGYRKIAGEVMKTTRRIKEGIQKFDSLEIISDPEMSILAFTSRNGNIFNIGDALESKGWHLDRLQFPNALHLTVTSLNIGKEDDFLEDLGEIIKNEAQLMKENKALNSSMKFAGKLSNVLPGSLIDKLAQEVGKMMGGKGRAGDVPQSALYGFSASIRKRKDVNKIVLNLLDGMF